MQRSIYFLSLISLLYISAPKANNLHVDALNKRLDYIFGNKRLRKSKISAVVYSLTKDKLLYSRNPNMLLSPASAVKLFTAYVALKRLGPNYRYKTSIHRAGSLVGGRLKGDLYIKGGADPSFVTEELYLMASELYRKGLRQVDGDIVLDLSIFRSQSNPHRIKNSTVRPYSAKHAALNLNYNSMTVYLKPGRAGQKVKVTLSPSVGLQKIRNTAITSQKKIGNRLRVDLREKENHDEIIVNGKMAYNLREQQTYIKVNHPERYFAKVLKKMLLDKGVKFNKSSKIRVASLPAKSKRLAKHESRPLSQIVRLMNKYSNNLIAEALVRTLAFEIANVPGDVEEGLKILRQEASLMGMDGEGLKIFSGSGLTRKNRMSADQFVSLLKTIYKDFDLLPEVLASLPVAGQDGTLEKRMSQTLAQNRLRAKTGTINGVSTLVGFLQSKGNEVLAFAILMNDYKQPPSNMRTWQDYFGQALAEHNSSKKRRTISQKSQ